MNKSISIISWVMLITISAQAMEDFELTKLLEESSSNTSYETLTKMTYHDINEQKLLLSESKSIFSNEHANAVEVDEYCHSQEVGKILLVGSASIVLNGALLMAFGPFGHSINTVICNSHFLCANAVCSSCCFLCPFCPCNLCDIHSCIP